MTLTMTIVAPWGVWQSSDHCLTNPRTKRPMQDSSVKHIAVLCPDGAALIAYTGLGGVPDIPGPGQLLSISDWVREILRGETRSLDNTLIFLRERATETLGPLVSSQQIPHTFVIGAFLQGQPWIIQIRNFHSTKSNEMSPPTNQFITLAQRIGSNPLICIAGTKEAVSPVNTAKLAEVATRKPRLPKHYRALLAKINCQASTHRCYGRFVSPSCCTSFMPPAGEPIESEFHRAKPDERKPMVVPLLVFGVDTTETSRALIETMRLLHPSLTVPRYMSF
jgi:hypothetical protein